MATDTAEMQDEKQEEWTMPKPQQEHAWLHRLVGEWTYEAEAPCGPDGALEKVRGTMTVRSIGGLWIHGESVGDMAGGVPMHSVITLGYDPQKGTFVGSWIGSMMTNFWVYDGTLDDDTLTLASEGPSFTTPGTTTMYHDVVEIVSDDHHTLTARVTGDDGKWSDMMQTHYYRKR